MMSQQPPSSPFLQIWRTVIQEIVQTEIRRALAELPLIGRWLPGDRVRGPIPGTAVPYGAAGYPVDVAATEADGAAALAARSDHRHAHGTGYLADAHHAQAHVITGADHTAAGLTAGHVLTALTATTIGFQTSAGAHIIQEEGAPLAARANLNFVGAGVAATDDVGNNATVVTIAGGGGGSVPPPVSAAGLLYAYRTMR